MSRLVANGLNLGNNRISALADGSAATDATTLQQVQALVNGLAWKQPVRVATTANGALATAYAAGQSVDGVTLTTNMRILLKDQTAGAENGIYTVNATGAPTRATDVASTSQLQNATVYVVAGTANADKSYTQTTNDVTPGTTAQTWVQQNAGMAYTAGNGLSLTGSAFAVVAGAGIIADGTSTRVDPAYAKLANKFSANVGDGSSTTITLTHNLGTKDRLGEPLLQDATSGAVVDGDITLGVNVDTLVFGTAPTSGQYRYSTAA